MRVRVVYKYKTLHGMVNDADGPKYTPQQALQKATESVVDKKLKFRYSLKKAFARSNWKYSALGDTGHCLEIPQTAIDNG